MKTIINLAGLCLLSTSLGEAQATDTFIVKDGQPRAEIVIAEQSPRSTRLAAQELQLYVEKISAAKLPIVTEPSRKASVKLCVGRSPQTDMLNVSADGLKCGAYRIVSGDDWLALIGDDTDFTPIEPWPRSNSDWVSGRVHDEWDRITGSHWGNPLSQLRKHYTGRTTTFGKPDHEATAEDGTVHVWGFDERGSYNAVCGFLRGLGVRWYMPGEIGEVVPKMATIPLEKIDETVRPDFPVRAFNIRFGVHGRETARWAMRLGIRNPYGLQTAHGLHTMTHNEHTLKNHPDWFALYGGKRHTQPGQRLNQLCYSNEELLGENRPLRAGPVRSLQIRRRLGDASGRLHGHLPMRPLPGQGRSPARLPRRPLRLRLGLRQPRGQRGPQDARRQDDLQLRLRHLHRAAANHRQAGTERTGDHRGRPSSHQRPA